MAEIPKTIKVGPITYTVQHSHLAAIEYAKSAGTDVWGVCQNRMSNIIIDEGYPLAPEQRVVLHELIHAVSCVYGLDDVKLGDEHCVDVLSTALLEVVQNNPGLMGYLMEAQVG